MTLVYLITSILLNLFFKIINILLKVRHQGRHCGDAMGSSSSSGCSPAHKPAVMILRALAPPTFPSLLDPYAYETVQLGEAYLKLWTLSSLQIPMSFPIQLAPFLSVSTTPHRANKMIFLNQTTWVAFLPKFSNGSKIHYMNFIHPNLTSLDGSSPCLSPACSGTTHLHDFKISWTQ